LRVKSDVRIGRSHSFGNKEKITGSLNMDRNEKRILECKRRFEYDKIFRNENGVFCGIDEAGRGPWIGSVYAAAVIFDDDTYIEGLNDSKKLTESKREKLYEEIIDKAVSWSVAYADVEEIEKLNILGATFLAMDRAVNGLSTIPDFAAADGNRVPKLSVPVKVYTIVKGDSLSASIAAASILAKVTRDRYMKELDKRYPEFNFASNKGYGTAEHIEAIKRYGVTPEHRRLFLRKLTAKVGELKEYKGKDIL